MAISELILLHQLLGNFEVHIARKESPPKWQSAETKAIQEVAIMVEKEVISLKSKLV